MALLLHGTAGSWRNFGSWLPALLPRQHVVIPDLPGFGESPPPPVDPGLETWAHIVHDLVAELEIAPRTLIGLGMGASIALAYLRMLGHRDDGLGTLDRLVLHTPGFYPGAFQPLARWVISGLTLAPKIVAPILGRPHVRDWAWRRFVEAPDASAEELAMLREDLQRASLQVLLRLARDMVRQDFRPFLSTVKIPVLAIVSEHDPFVRASEVARLRELMPHATCVIQRGGAHSWTAQTIAEQRRLLAAFLDNPGALATVRWES